MAEGESIDEQLAKIIGPVIPPPLTEEESELKAMMAMASDMAIDLMVRVYTDKRIPPAMASFMRDTYDQLLLQGFGSDEALQIVTGIHQNALGSLLKGQKS